MLLPFLIIAVATTLSPTSSPKTSTPFAETQSAFSPSTAALLAQLSPVERKEYLAARAQSLQDPAVQSTREIVRMTLHKAMLQADPGIDAILANMNAKVPEMLLENSNQEKKMGAHFDQWLSNIPSQAQKNLTSAELAQLKTAHQKAMKNPAVISARNIAQSTFCNAMINANPLIGPVLKKMGLNPPVGMPGLGSEEKILGGNFQEWATEILAPTISNLSQAERIQLQTAHDQVKNNPTVIAARVARDNATTLLDQTTTEENFKRVTREAMLAIDPTIKPILDKLQIQTSPLATATPKK
ncbi:MAG: hypothetical protein A3F67_06690 [Verrucomicrobia bacterium RIFCSPHIGHO2_12_FULL_41_10]|nr:MAG: hypothetical protein A3F67_06690 [Verrucomicrobia bacterium RIFCSPHIGHO2_12_FULL_41_10]HLB32644.1 hypothetical protein [Chthoniobacterales bacterium]